MISQLHNRNLKNTKAMNEMLLYKQNSDNFKLNSRKVFLLIKLHVLLKLIKKV
jgi:hypothetical protein